MAKRKRTKRQTNGLQNTTQNLRKLKIEQHEPNKKKNSVNFFMSIYYRIKRIFPEFIDV